MRTRMTSQFLRRSLFISGPVEVDNKYFAIFSPLFKFGGNRNIYAAVIKTKPNIDELDPK